ncbi:hypothetical protein [Hymenobacter sp. 102]|uniref:hypothetical protein n=1 Tax=Hymenobacter sp. 102 TaxID=3403152 RepID=UPI003CEB4E6E
MRKLSSLCFLLSGCSLVGASEKCEPGDNKVYHSAVISFSLLEQRTSRNLLAWNGPYYPDSVKVVASTGEVVFPGPLRPDGYVDFHALKYEMDKLPLGIDLVRTYYLRLNRADQDTFALSFRLKNNRCDFAEFERYTLRYNGRIVAEGEGLYLPSLTLYKP